MLHDFRTDVLPLKDKIFRVALRVTLDRAEAEDITQETLIRVWTHREQWSEIANMEAYCLTIARRMALDHLKRKKPERLDAFADLSGSTAPTSKPDALTTDALSPDEALDQKQRMETLRRLIDQLPEVQRTILQLRDIEGMRYDEIARVTGLSETQVKVYLHRARTKVRDAASRS